MLLSIVQFRSAQDTFNLTTVSLSRDSFKSHHQAVLLFVTALSTMHLSHYDLLASAELKTASLAQMKHQLLSLRDFRQSHVRDQYPDL